MNLNISLLGIFILFYLSSILSGYATENQTKINYENISNLTDIFAIQYAQTGSFSEINMTFTLEANEESNNTILSSDTSKTFNLTLNNISNKTILLYNNHETKVKTINTENFIRNWSLQKMDLKDNDRSNAYLTIGELQKDQQDTFILKVFNPQFHKNQKLLIYTVEITNNIQNYNKLPNQFNNVTLIIHR